MTSPRGSLGIESKQSCHGTRRASESLQPPHRGSASVLSCPPLSDSIEDMHSCWQPSTNCIKHSLEIQQSDIRIQKFQY